ncbi:MAG: hypothetical protein U5K43_08060, partial [Halofilum sp. (in: g-proteobacteria)]|nr:hypothetical protein [Halofilum sp. (in: g-proteobacteria)]
WHDPQVRCLGMFLLGEGLEEYDARNRRRLDDNFLLLLNADPEAVEFHLPRKPGHARWEPLIDTTVAVAPDGGTWAPGAKFAVSARALLLLRQPSPEATRASKDMP